jgi:hypothetical protein
MLPNPPHRRAAVNAALRDLEPGKVKRWLERLLLHGERACSADLPAAQAPRADAEPGPAGKSDNPNGK